MGLRLAVPIPRSAQSEAASWATQLVRNSEKEGVEFTVRT